MFSVANRLIPLSPEFVQPFEEKAKEDKVRYEKEKADYSPPEGEDAAPVKKAAPKKKAKKVESEDEVSDEPVKADDDDEESE